MRIIYGICSWGLGHATRSLPVIRKLIKEDNEITIISNGRSLKLLQDELRDKARFIDVPDYPMLLSENARKFMAKSLLYWPLFIKRIQLGYTQLLKILQKEKYDTIISDARYDIHNTKIPSFFISHQMRIMNPLRIKVLEIGSEYFNLYFFKRYTGIIVPDYKDDDLSGDLSHNLKKIDEENINYVGVLSDFKKNNTKKDIDYLLSITGPEPQRSIFEKKILSQVELLDGKIVVTLGKTEKKDILTKENIKTYSYLSREDRENLLNRAKLVISRSGYSTILDLAVIGTKALLSPTPGQIEQEYLSKYHNKKRTFFSIHQDKINLIENIKEAKKYTGIMRKCNVDKTVNKIIEIIH